MGTTNSNEWLRCGSCNSYLPSLSSYQTHFLTRHKTGNEITSDPEPSQVLKLVECQVIISKTGDLRQMEHGSDKHPNANNEPITTRSGKKAKASLKMHILIHTGEKPYRCDLCPRSFAQQSNLRTHKKIHGGNQPRPFSCDKCDKTYVKKYELNMHIKSVHDKLERFWCSICNKGFIYKYHLTKHIASQLEERLHSCVFCGKSFKAEGALHLHMKIHLNEKHYNCQTCGKGFVQRGNLESHQESCGKTHEERTKLLCDFCPATFITPRTLLRHKYKVHGVEPDKKFECDICPWQFVTSSELKLHSRTHSGVKEYQCDLCHKAFYGNGDLRKHKRTHELNRPRPFHCANCNNTFTTHRLLKAHMDGVHDKVERFWCSICNKGFQYLGALMRHTATHVEDRSFKCQFCEKSFKQEHAAKLHMERIHLGGRGRKQRATQA